MGCLRSKCRMSRSPALYILDSMLKSFWANIMSLPTVNSKIQVIFLKPYWESRSEFCPLTLNLDFTSVERTSPHILMLAQLTNKG